MSRPSMDQAGSLTNGDSSHEKLNGEMLNGIDKDPSVAIDSAPAAAKASKKGKQGGSTVEQDLREQLERANVEKEELETQYRTLLDRLTEMRTKIGLKLQQDAEEMEQREALITTLTAQNEDLQSTVNSLTSELSLGNAESERVTKELDNLRSTLQQQQQSSTLALSTEISSLSLESQSLRDQLREKDDLLERGKLEKEEWEKILVEERIAAETLRGENRTLRRELDNERIARRRFEKDWEEEHTRANNLESVLAEFEDGQQASISSIKETYTSQIDSLTQSLAEYKSRALNAEVELQDGKSSSGRVEKLEKELKEKDVLLTKVRSEAVTLNEHLIQALRRLRKFSADPSGSNASSGSSPSYVDRRLVTNIFLQFLTTPRADKKRFEMLNLLGSILGWGDEERERAGLQRGSVSGSVSPVTGSMPKVKGKTGDDERGDESFSKMWVEFLLKEASQGSGPASVTASPSHAHTPSLFSPSAYAPSNYAPSTYAKSNYAASSAGPPSPTQSYTSLPPLPPLSSASGGGSNGSSRSVSGAYRLPSLSKGKPRDATGDSGGF